jgi:hypothetical protein
MAWPYGKVAQYVAKRPGSAPPTFRASIALHDESAKNRRDLERLMSNTFGTDILIQAEDPTKAASFYVNELGFEITDQTPNLVSLHGKNINLFIERGPALGPVLEVTVKSLKEAKANLTAKGCQVIKDEPDFPRCYVRDPNGLIYNLTE